MNAVDTAPHHRTDKSYSPFPHDMTLSSAHSGRAAQDPVITSLKIALLTSLAFCFGLKKGADSESATRLMREIADPKGLSHEEASRLVRRLIGHSLGSETDQRAGQWIKELLEATDRCGVPCYQMFLFNLPKGGRRHDAFMKRLVTLIDHRSPDKKSRHQSRPETIS